MSPYPPICCCRWTPEAVLSNKAHPDICHNMSWCVFLYLLILTSCDNFMSILGDTQYLAKSEVFWISQRS